MGDLQTCRSGRKKCAACGHCAQHCGCAVPTPPAGLPPAARRPGQSPRRTAAQVAAAKLLVCAERDADVHVGRLCDVGCQAAIEAASPPPPADLAELAARLSFSGTEKQSFVRNGQKGKGAKHSGLSADYKRRRFAALDQALQVSASLIDPHESEELIAEWHARRAAKKPATVATNLLSNTIKFMEASPPTSETRAICSSLLCASVPGPMLTRLSNVRALRPKERAAAIANFELGSAGQPVKRKTKRVPRTRQLAITNLVRWVLRSDNVQLLSWGEKKVRIGKRWKTIPCLSRTMELEEMWRKYDADFKGVNKNDRVHRTNFLLIISDITGKQCQSVKAVDYLVSELVHQNRERLERLIRGVIKDPVFNCADGSHAVSGWKVCRLCSSQHTRQPDDAGGHCITLQCPVVTAVMALVAERGASSVSVWVDSCDRLSQHSCSSFAPGEPSPMQTFAEWVGGLSWGGVPLKNRSVSRENEVPRGSRQCGLRH